MAKPRPTTSPTRALTDERASRLCRLLRTTAGKGATRAALLKKLKLDVRAFYRDLETLRALGIVVELADGKYVLRGSVEETVAQLPLPDPHLSLGEAQQLGKGRTAAHRKLQKLVAKILPR
jgi:predicted DNA-binding transcriptional regulator YafY